MEGFLHELVLEELEDQHGFLGNKDYFTATKLKMFMQMNIGRYVVLFFKPNDSSRLTGLIEQFDQIMTLVETLKYDEHLVNKEEFKKALG